MNRSNLIERINQTFEVIFSGKFTNFKNLELNKTIEWDSLRHIQLILALEKEFSIKIKTSEIEKLNSYKKIIEILIKKSALS